MMDPKHEKALRTYAEELGVDPDLAVAVGTQESGSLGEKAVSPKGARGVMQVMPDTSKALAPKYGPDTRRQGVGYLRDLSKQYQGSDEYALAAYNAGPGNLAKARERAKQAGLPDTFEHVSRFLPEETRNYVPSVLSRRKGRSTTVTPGAGVAAVETDPDSPEALLAGATGGADLDSPEALLAGASSPPQTGAPSPAFDDTPTFGGSLARRTVGRVSGALDAALGHAPSDLAAYAGARSAGDEAGASEALARHGGTGSRLRDVGLGLLELYLTGKMPGTSLGTATVGSATEAATGSKEAGDVAEIATGLAPAVKAVGSATARGVRTLKGSGKSSTEMVTEGLGAQRSAQEVGRELQAPGKGAHAAITETAEEASRQYNEAGSLARAAGAQVPATDTSIVKAARAAVRDAKAQGRPLTGNVRRVVTNILRMGRGQKTAASTILAPGGGPARAAGASRKAVNVDELIEAQSNLRREINALPKDDISRRPLIQLSKTIDDAMAAAAKGTPVGEKLQGAREFYREVTIPTRKTMSRVARAEEPEAATRVLTSGNRPSRFQRLEAQQLGANGEKFANVVEGTRSSYFQDLIQKATRDGRVDLRELSNSLSKAEGAGQLGQMANSTARRQTIKAIRKAARIQRLAGDAPSAGGGTGAIGGWFGIGAGYALGRIVRVSLTNERASRALLTLSSARQGTSGWKAARRVLTKILGKTAPAAASTVKAVREEEQ